MYTLAMLMVLAISDVDVSTDRPEPQQALLAGVAAVESSDWLGAQRAFERVAKASSDDSLKHAASLGVAESLFRQGRYEAAGDHFETLYNGHASTAKPAGSFVTLRWSQSLAHQARWHAAAKVAQQALKNQTDPSQRIPLVYLLGRCYTAQSMHDAAREQYYLVVRTSGVANTMQARVLWMIAYSYAAQGEIETARETFLRVEEKCSADPRLAARALVEAGRCSERRGQWKEAEATYQQAVAKYGESEVSDEADRRLAVVQIRISHQKNGVNKSKRS
jgi:TolA-binding protein